MSKVSASCHCGAVCFEAKESEWALGCNCSHCRLYGGVFWTKSGSPVLPSHDAPTNNAK